MTLWRSGFAIFALLVYLAFPTKNYYWDGISFAQKIETAASWRDLLHPNHLIYNLTGWSVYHALAAKFRALYVLQAMNAVWAAGAAYLLAGILRLAVPVRAALLLSALFAFAGTWWRYATDADAYIPSVTLLIACAYFLVPEKRPKPFVVALLHTAAMLLHQLALLLFPAALYALWHQYNGGMPPGKRLRGVALYIALSGGLTLGAYVLAFTAVTGSFAPRPFLLWMTSYAENATFSFRLARNLGVSLRSWAQLFFTGRPSLLHYSDPITVILLLFCVAALIALVVALARGKFRIRIYRQLWFRFALLWILSYALFFFFWQPQNTFYKVFGLPAFILLAASCWEPGSEPRARGAGTAFVAFMALSNLTLAVIPYSRVSSNAVVAFAMSLHGSLNAGSVVFFRDFNTDNWFAQYFNPQSVWKHAETTADIDMDLREGKSVWLETTAVEHFSAAEPAWFQTRTKSGGRRIRFVRLVAP